MGSLRLVRMYQVIIFHLKPRCLVLVCFLVPGFGLLLLPAWVARYRFTVLVKLTVMAQRAPHEMGHT